MNIKNKNVLIIGPPASGKTTLSKELSKRPNDHVLLHTDDYIPHGYEQALYVLMEDMKKLQCNTIIEGVLGYRLLRKGVQLNCYYPDLVIEMQITAEQQARIYQQERDAKKLQYLKGFAATHQKILNDYFELIGDRKPEWIKINVHNI
jgi:adenylate kinase family enzyme